MEIAATCDHLVDAPEIAARTLVRQGRLVEVPFPGPHRAAPLFVHVNADRCLAHVHQAVTDGLKDLINPRP